MRGVRCYGVCLPLDMGEPVKVVDMARHLIKLSGFEPDKDIEIKFVGRRPGEKMFEELWNEDETPVRTEFEKIFVAKSNGPDRKGVIMKLREILRHAERMERERMFEKMQELIPNYRRDGGERNFGFRNADCESWIAD